jgi:hypothetical protein
MNDKILAVVIYVGMTLSFAAYIFVLVTSGAGWPSMHVGGSGKFTAIAASAVLVCLGIAYVLRTRELRWMCLVLAAWAILFLLSVWITNINIRLIVGGGALLQITSTILLYRIISRRTPPAI